MILEDLIEEVEIKIKESSYEAIYIQQLTNFKWLKDPGNWVVIEKEKLQELCKLAKQ